MIRYKGRKKSNCRSSSILAQELFVLNFFFIIRRFAIQHSEMRLTFRCLHLSVRALHGHVHRLWHSRCFVPTYRLISVSYSRTPRVSRCAVSRGPTYNEQIGRFLSSTETTALLSFQTVQSKRFLLCESEFLE
jgi:hypothetical protein